MRPLLVSALAILLTAAPAGADEPARVRPLIDKALQAVGGEAKVPRAYTQKLKGKFHGAGGPAEFTGEWVVAFPDRIRETIDTESQGMKFRFVKVVAGDKGWLRINDLVEELKDDALAEEREQVHAARVATLLPLKDTEYALTPLPDQKVNGRDAAGLKVSRKDRRDVALFFDKEKDWLLKSESRVKVAGREATQEVFYDDYRKAADGLRPWKTIVKRDGKVLVEAELTEFTPLEKPDDKPFTKP